MKKFLQSRAAFISLNIKRVRLDKSYSQDYLAFKLNISQNAYCKIEQGHTALTLDRLFQISDILNVSVLELIGGDAPLPTISAAVSSA